MDVRISADRNLWFRQSGGGDREGRKERAEQPRGVSRQPEARVGKRRIFVIFFRRNPLKSPDSTKGIQGNPRTFPCFYLDLLASNSRCGCTRGLLDAAVCGLA